MAQTVTNRRGLFTGSLIKGKDVIYPPGVTASSVRNCTGCGACAEICPSRIIAIRAGVPALDLAQGECTFCGKCAERCPERVFPSEPQNRFQHTVAIGEDCLAVNYVDCQACRDVCPPVAIRFRPRMGGPFIPILDAEACTGCGACISVCPTQSIAITARQAEVTHV